MGRKKTNTIPCENIKLTEEEKILKDKYDKIIAEEEKINNSELFSDYVNLDKPYNGFEIFIAFARNDLIFEIEINDVVRNLIQLKQNEKYQELLKDYDYNTNGQFVELAIEIYQLLNKKKIGLSTNNSRIICSYHSYEETNKIMNQFDGEKKLLFMSLVNDFRQLNTEYYEEQKNYQKAI